MTDKTDTERAAFEKWAILQMYGVERNKFDGYLEEPCDLAWSAWEARASLEAPAAQEPATSSRSATVQEVEDIVDEYVAGYVMEGDDGYHLPTEAEKFLIKDAVMGLLAEPDFIAAFVSEAKACPELAQDAAIAQDAQDAARYRWLREANDGFY